MSPTRHSQSTGVALGKTWASRGSARVVHVYVSGATAIGGPQQLAPGIPQMIPEEELLFWTPEWRELEGRSLGQLSRGESRQFANFRDMARHLLRGEDED
jgi:hypothetical protein